MSYFTAKMHQIRFCALGSLQHSPDPLAGFKGPKSKGREAEGKRGERKRRKKGREERGAKGVPDLKVEKMATLTVNETILSITS